MTGSVDRLPGDVQVAVMGNSKKMPRALDSEMCPLPAAAPLPMKIRETLTIGPRPSRGCRNHRAGIRAQWMVTRIRRQRL